jgi:DNA adenine methylase
VRATRFIYLNRFCFNGLYRTNLKGEFNVPYGGEKSGSLPSLDSLLKVSSALSGADIRNEDFRDVLSLARKGDFVYLDPPYAVENKRIFTQYGPDVFGSSDLEDLRTMLEQLDREGIPFMLSYAYSKHTKEFFSAWKTKRLITTRNIAGFSSYRKTSAELLVRNY